MRIHPSLIICEIAKVTMIPIIRKPSRRKPTAEIKVLREASKNSKNEPSLKIRFCICRLAMGPFEDKNFLIPH